MKNHILVGLGGTGGKVLQEFKKRIFEEFPSQEYRENLPISLIHVDLTNDISHGYSPFHTDLIINGQNASLTRSEFLEIGGIDLEEIIENMHNFPYLKQLGWTKEELKEAIGYTGNNTGGKRIVGRLLFAINIRYYIHALQKGYQKNSINTGHKIYCSPFIHIFTSLTGGTGSGALIDAILQARKTFPEAIIKVYALLPELNQPEPLNTHEFYYSNAYAALLELNALMTDRWYPKDVSGDTSVENFKHRIRGFVDSLTLFDPTDNIHGKRVNSLKEFPKIVSDFLSLTILHSENNIGIHNFNKISDFECLYDIINEYDECVMPDNKRVPIARTKKINSVNIKRIVYPRLKIQRHLFYAVGLSMINQMLYNNWNRDYGYVKENKNSVPEITAHLIRHKWNFKLFYFMLDKPILDSQEFSDFETTWHRFVDNVSRIVWENSENPVKELYINSVDFYKNRFREEGVEKYFENKERVIPEIAWKIVEKIRTDLFEIWINGDISFKELIGMIDFVINHLIHIRNEDIENFIFNEREETDDLQKKIDDDIAFWNLLPYRLLKKLYLKRYCEASRNITELFVIKTQVYSLDFAKKLITKTISELENFKQEVTSLFYDLENISGKIEDLLFKTELKDESEVNLSERVIELYDYNYIFEFEHNLKRDWYEMQIFCKRLRENFIKSFNLCKNYNKISQNELWDFFNLKLPEILSCKMKQISDSDIISELQKRFIDETSIKEFVDSMMSEDMAVHLDENELNLHLRNNEGYLSPDHPLGQPQRLYVVMGPPALSEPMDMENTNESFPKFFWESIYTGGYKFDIINNIYEGKERWNDNSSNDEINILSLTYLFPMRAIAGLHRLKEKYDRALNGSGSKSNERAEILLHSEKHSQTLPNLFANQRNCEN